MSDNGGLSPREHDELRDIVLAGTQRIRRAGAGRAKFVAAGVALVLVGGIAGAVLATVVRDDEPIAPAPAPTSPPAPVPGPWENGWLAFTAGREESDILLVREDAEPVRALGVGDGADEECPAVSPDGARLVAGRAGEGATGPASLVFADISADGAASETASIPLPGVLQAPCAQWSPDGAWVAFAVDRSEDTYPQFARELRIVDTVSHESRSLSGVGVRDFAWAPDAEELYFSDGRWVHAYVVRTGETREIARGFWFDVSPDGRSLAVAQVREDAVDRYDLVVMDVDGFNDRLLVEKYLAIHGVGPVWSPDGRSIVIQRGCGTYNDVSGAERICREQHVAVVIDVATGAQTEIAPPETVLPEWSAGTDPLQWFPWSVTWSPDGASLLYVAWPEGDVTDPSIVGLLAVPADGSRDEPVVLYAGGDVRVLSGSLWNVAQSWGPRPH